MGKIILLATVSLFVALPVHAEDGLLPALCNYVTAEVKPDLSELLVREIKDIPKNLAYGTVAKVDSVTASLSEKLEGYKSDDQGAVLGTSTMSRVLPASARDKGIGILQTLLDHWLWTISGLGVLVLIWAFRH